MHRHRQKMVRERDLNSYTLRCQILSLVRLPIPPLSHMHPNRPAFISRV